MPKARQKNELITLIEEAQAKAIETGNQLYTFSTFISKKGQKQHRVTPTIKDAKQRTTSSGWSLRKNSVWTSDAAKKFVEHMKVYSSYDVLMEKVYVHIGFKRDHNLEDSNGYDEPLLIGPHGNCANTQQVSQPPMMVEQDEGIATPIPATITPNVDEENETSIPQMLQPTINTNDGDHADLEGTNDGNKIAWEQELQNLTYTKRLYAGTKRKKHRNSANRRLRQCFLSLARRASDNTEALRRLYQAQIFLAHLNSVPLGKWKKLLEAYSNVDEELPGWARPIPLPELQKKLRLSERVIAKMEDGFIRSAARMSMDNQPPLETTDKIREKLKAMHPQRKTENPFGDQPNIDSNDIPYITQEGICDVIRKMRYDTGSGIFQWKMEHILNLFGNLDDTNNVFIKLLAKHANEILRGPAEDSPLFKLRYMALAKRIITLMKPGHTDEAPKVRPLGLLPMFTRISLKAISNALSANMNYYSNQLGVGVPGGAELPIHYLKKTMDGLSAGELWFITRVDTANAFNTLSQSVMAKAISENNPEAFNMAKFLYNEAQPCVCDDGTIIWNTEGVTQGEPSSGLLFGLGYKKRASWVYDMLERGDTYITIHDDLFLLTKKKETAMKIIQEWSSPAAPQDGLMLNNDKHIFTDTDAIRMEGLPVELIQGEYDGGMDLHGGFIGSDAKTAAYINGMIEKAKTKLNKLKESTLYQDRLILFTMCFTTKFTHFLRTTQPGPLARNALNDLKILQNGVIDELRGTDMAWAQANQLLKYTDPETGTTHNISRILERLPTKKGGLGISDPLQIWEAAYKSSREQALRIMTLRKVGPKGVEDGHKHVIDIDEPILSQKQRTEQLHKKDFELVMKAFNSVNDKRNIRRFVENQQKIARAWLERIGPGSLIGSARISDWNTQVALTRWTFTSNMTMRGHTGDQSAVRRHDACRDSIHDITRDQDTVGLEVFKDGSVIEPGIGKCHEGLKRRADLRIYGNAIDDTADCTIDLAIKNIHLGSAVAQCNRVQTIGETPQPAEANGLLELAKKQIEYALHEKYQWKIRAYAAYKLPTTPKVDMVIFSSGGYEHSKAREWMRRFSANKRQQIRRAIGFTLLCYGNVGYVVNPCISGAPSCH